MEAVFHCHCFPCRYPEIVSFFLILSQSSFFHSSIRRGFGRLRRARGGIPCDRGLALFQFLSMPLRDRLSRAPACLRACRRRHHGRLFRLFQITLSPSRGFRILEAQESFRGLGIQEHSRFPIVKAHMDVRRLKIHDRSPSKPRVRDFLSFHPSSLPFCQFLTLFYQTITSKIQWSKTQKTGPCPRNNPRMPGPVNGFFQASDGGRLRKYRSISSFAVRLSG